MASKIYPETTYHYCSITLHHNPKWLTISMSPHLGLHLMCPIFLSDFNQILSCLTDFFLWKSNFTKIRPVGAAMTHADGRTDRQTNEANRRFSRITLTRLKIWMLKETEWVNVGRINLAQCRAVANKVMNF